MFEKRFAIPLGSVFGTFRNSSQARARAASIYVAREFLRLSYPEIGRQFGRDHSTCIHAVRRCNRWMREDAFTRSIVNRVLRKLHQQAMAESASETEHTTRYDPGQCVSALIANADSAGVNRLCDGGFEPSFTSSRVT
jgi:hypothetical protein